MRQKKTVVPRYDCWLRAAQSELCDDATVDGGFIGGGPDIKGPGRIPICNRLGGMVCGMPGRMPGGSMLGGIMPGPGGIRGGPNPVGGGTAVIFGGGAENGFWAILPALNAAVVASIKCCACSSIHFW